VDGRFSPGGPVAPARSARPDLTPVAAQLRITLAGAGLLGDYVDPVPNSSDGQAVYREPPAGAGVIERSTASCPRNRYRLAVRAAATGDFASRVKDGGSEPGWTGPTTWRPGQTADLRGIVVLLALFAIRVAGG
jgi:hypothetical protein